MLCTKSTKTVEDFFDYDFVGAPMEAGEGFSGGLSLRNPRLFLSITSEANFDNSPINSEDQWFYSEAKVRAQTHGVRLPNEDVAKTFAVESIWYDTPLGYHQPQRWQSVKMHLIDDWCPEVRMSIGRRVK
jgi:hypothetical protein